LIGRVGGVDGPAIFADLDAELPRISGRVLFVFLVSLGA
jgi:hypothetical protein